MYAVAVMIYQMVEGRMPFDGPRSASHEPPQPEALTAPQWDVLKSGFAWDPDARPASVTALLAALNAAVGPTPQELAAEQAAPRAKEEQRLAQLALRRKAEAEAAAAAQLIKEKQRREQEALERAEAEVAKRERKEALRRQLLERREADAAKARQAKEDLQRARCKPRRRRPTAASRNAPAPTWPRAPPTNWRP
ncbi:hypothetical protein LP419_01720 [Massilia sp. H-1]|nr:hypothetical protein LP419_01720 [Massilia sp. H-1]